jgi:glutaredoxin
MKDVTLFMFEGCPHCRRARELLDDILAEHSEYAQVPLAMIDERLHPEIAEKHDYYYVPAFYAGEEKMMEGVPSRQAIEKVFARALEQE